MKLLHALYRLRQAARAWWLELKKSMQELGFKCVYADSGIFVFKSKHGDIVIISIYVDDGLFTGNNPDKVKELKACFMAKWECRNLGKVSEFLSMKVTHDPFGYRLNQRAYLLKVLKRFNCLEVKPADTPLPERYLLAKSDQPINKAQQSLFQQIIRSLLYLFLGT